LSDVHLNDFDPFSGQLSRRGPEKELTLVSIKSDLKVCHVAWVLGDEALIQIEVERAKDLNYTVFFFRVS